MRFNPTGNHPEARADTAGLQNHQKSLRLVHVKVLCLFLPVR